MNKGELIAKIAEKAGSSKAEAEKFFEAFSEAVIESVKEGDKVTVSPLGIFSADVRQARKGRNPKTGEAIDIPECNVVKFKVSKTFKDAIN